MARMTSGSKKPCCGKIPQSIKKHADILCVLAKAKPALVKAIIAKAEPSLIKAISECSYNLLRGNITLTPTQIRRLRSYKTAIRALASKKTPLTRKRALLQKGGLLPGALLASLAPMLISGIGQAITGSIASRKARKAAKKRRESEYY